MRKDITEYLDKFLECQQVKAEHQHLVGLLHPLPIPKWKWDTITLDFIIGLPRYKKKNDSIMVVVDKLSKITHFIPKKSTYKIVEIVNIFMKEIFRLHGIPKVVIQIGMKIYLRILEIHFPKFGYTDLPGTTLILMDGMSN